MKLLLGTLADRGCWIADDLVYAFIGSGGSLIGELGFHGQQPASRNASLLVHQRGVLTVSTRGRNGREELLRWSEADWSPSAVTLHARAGGGDFRIRVAASGRSVRVSVTRSGRGSHEVLFRVHQRGFFTNVHGERTWETPELSGKGLRLRCTDRIVLDRWISRKGPYAGDFLIPEPWRRILFHRRFPSGTGSAADLVPEMKNLALPLYEARTSVTFECGASPLRVRNGYLFRVPAGGAGRSAECVITCMEMWAEYSSVPRPVRLASKRIRVPELRVSGYPAVEEFFRSVPAIVDSAVVRDTGMLKANPGRYYWIWAWDALVSAAEAFLWGGAPVAVRTGRFVNAHRDDCDRIPARWTHSLLPLDTPPAGSLDFLLASLAWRVWTETGERQLLQDVYPFLVRHLRWGEQELGPRGVPRGPGFYPDLPVRFGRTEESAAAMEAGTWHGLSVLVQRMALMLGDAATAARAGRASAQVEKEFDRIFWDERRGFFVDAFGPGPDERNESYPLFSLLMLQAPAGFSVVRRRVDQCALFIERELLTAHGVRVLPSWDKNAGSESISDAWYPHWDLYAIRILRRAGRQESIHHWLSLVERLIGRLGYCPEFLSLLPFERGQPDPWKAHGAPSNLNGVTGWYRALVEGVAGVDTDPGGLQILPGGVPLGDVILSGIHFQSSVWDIRVRHDGPNLNGLAVDGTELRGCAKIPSSFHDGRRHQVTVRFGSREPNFMVREITEAEVISAGEERGYPVMRLRGFGPSEVVFVSDRRCQLTIDGKAALHEWDEDTGAGRAVLPLCGAHVVRIEPFRRDR